MPVDDYRGPNGELASGYCHCGGVLSSWLTGEYPFVRQGVMHSPVGCVRRELDLDDLRALFFDLTGQGLGPEVQLRTAFQVVAGRLAADPGTLAEVYRGNLPSQAGYSAVFQREFRPTAVGSKPGGGVGRGTVIPPPASLPVKPPWEA